MVIFSKINLFQIFYFNHGQLIQGFEGRIGSFLNLLLRKIIPNALKMTIETVKSKQRKLNSLADPFMVRTNRLKFWLWRPSLAILNTRKIRIIRSSARKATFSVALPTFLAFQVTLYNSGLNG